MQQSPAQARQSLQFYASGVPPCPPAGASCKNDGSETLNGRNAEKWEISQSVQGQTLLTHVWVDTKLQVWTKLEVIAGSSLVLSNELQGIREAPQPASLFIIPAGFRDVSVPRTGGNADAIQPQVRKSRHPIQRALSFGKEPLC